MGKDSKIEWTDHTFNPWIGCAKVSAGCANCYAEARNNRFKDVVWGPKGTRKRTSEANWKLPIRWNKQAKETGTRPRVFCGSLCDVFEDRPDLVEWRRDLFRLISATPNIIWMLLTKRPENVNRMIEKVTGFSDSSMWFHSAPNVWIGTSVENQEAADKRIPELLQIPAAVRFLSVEPMLGPVSITDQPYWDWRYSYGFYPKALGITKPIDWVICGGESGSKARPLHPDWVRSLRDQCVEADISFFFKQWGEYAPYGVSGDGEQIMRRVGKKYAGRWLDRHLWDEVPKVENDG